MTYKQLRSLGFKTYQNLAAAFTSIIYTLTLASVSRNPDNVERFALYITGTCFGISSFLMYREGIKDFSSSQCIASTSPETRNNKIASTIIHPKDLLNTPLHQPTKSCASRYISHKILRKYIGMIAVLFRAFLVPNSLINKYHTNVTTTIILRICGCLVLSLAKLPLHSRAKWVKDNRILIPTSLVSASTSSWITFNLINQITKHRTTNNIIFLIFYWALSLTVLITEFRSEQRQIKNHTISRADQVAIFCTAALYAIFPIAKFTLSLPLLPRWTVYISSCSTLFYTYIAYYYLQPPADDSARISPQNIESLNNQVEPTATAPSSPTPSPPVPGEDNTRDAITPPPEFHAEHLVGSIP